MEEQKNINQQPTDQELKMLMTRIIANQQAMNPDWYEEEEDIDWMKYVRRLQKGWKTLAVVTLLFAVLGVGASLLMKRTYTVTVSLAPEAKGQGGGGALSSLASTLLGGGSVNIGNSEDALNVSLFSEIAASTPFLTSLYGVQVAPYVSPQQQLSGVVPDSPKPLFDFLTNVPQQSWLSKLLGGNDEEAYNKIYDDSRIDLARLTPKQQQVVDVLGKAIRVEIDKKTSVVSISTTWDDPQIATVLADSVCNRLQAYVIEYRTQKSRADYEYYSRMSDEAKEKMLKAQTLYARSVDNNRNVILESVLGSQERLQAEYNMAQSIYQQRETQKEAARAKCQEMKPVFAVIQPAAFPIRPNQSRKNTVLACMLLGFLLSGVWVAIGKEYYDLFKEQMKENEAQS